MTILTNKDKEVAREVAEQFDGIDLNELFEALEERARDTSQQFRPYYAACSLQYMRPLAKE